MLKELEELQRQAESELRKSNTEEELLAVKTKYLGRKGILTKLLRGLGNIEPEVRPQVGNRCNEIKATLTAAIENALKARTALKKGEVLLRDRIDVTLPGRKVRFGKEHPVALVCKDICDIFAGLGFSAVQGPEIELDYYNFEALNIPKDHPARDMQDTFYVEDNIVLRTHTSPVQIRVMEKQRPPVRILSPGRVYRPDSDISHTPMFHQIEGLLVDKGITFGDLKGVLTLFLKQMFGGDTALRFRPSFFPFTEPSAEVDISASCAEALVVESVLRAAGLKYSVPAWLIRRSSRM